MPNLRFLYAIRNTSQKEALEVLRSILNIPSDDRGKVMVLGSSSELEQYSIDPTCTLVIESDQDCADVVNTVCEEMGLTMHPLPVINMPATAGGKMIN